MAWAGVEHYKRGMTEPPPPVGEPEDARVQTPNLSRFTIHLHVTLHNLSLLHI